MKNISKSSVEEIVAYYKTNYNGGFLPPENDVNTLGYQFLKNDAKKALSYFQLNVNNYPNSSNAFDSLGEVYMLLGDKKNAIMSYEKSFELDSRNENALKMIQQLKSE